MKSIIYTLSVGLLSLLGAFILLAYTGFFTRWDPLIPDEQIFKTCSLAKEYNKQIMLSSKNAKKWRLAGLIETPRQINRRCKCRSSQITRNSFLMKDMKLIAELYAKTDSLAADYYLSRTTASRYSGEFKKLINERYGERPVTEVLDGFSDTKLKYLVHVNNKMMHRSLYYGRP